MAHLPRQRRAARRDAEPPRPPPWRQLAPGQASANRARTYQIDPDEVNLVNAALRLAQALLVTGKPGTGKTSLADSIAYDSSSGRYYLAYHQPLDPGGRTLQLRCHRAAS